MLKHAKTVPFKPEARPVYNLLKAVFEPTGRRTLLLWLMVGIYLIIIVVSGTGSDFSRKKIFKRKKK